MKRIFFPLLLFAGAILVVVFANQCSTTPTPTPPPKATGTEAQPSVPAPTSTTTSPRAPTRTTRSATILLDDFSPQPYQGESVYFYNRLEGDRGAVNDSILDWGDGQVTTIVSSGNSWGGVWMSLNHPIREGLSIDFSAILPSP